MPRREVRPAGRASFFGGQAVGEPAAPDPYVNTASVSCEVDGFPNVLNASDSWTVNLFQPSIAFDKSADAPLSKEGDTVNYTLTLDNTSSADRRDRDWRVYP